MNRPRRIPEWLLPWLPALVAAILAIVLYLPSLHADFVWDDVFFVEKNPAVHDWSYFDEAFTSPEVYFASNADDPTAPQIYRPLRNISYLLDHSIWGLNASGFRLQNLLLHGVNTLLVALIGGRLVQRRSAMWIAGILFAVHPALSEAVVWIKARDALLSAFFCLTAFSIFLGSLEHKLSWGAMVGILALYAGGLLSYLTALSLLPIFIAVVWFWKSQWPIENFRRYLILFVGMAILAAAFLVLRHVVLGRSSQTDYIVEGSFWKTMITMIPVTMTYLRLTLFPLKLNADYFGYPFYESLTHPVVLGSLALLILLLAATAVAWRRGKRRLVVGVLWYALFLLPVMNIIPTMQLLAERFLYLPLVGAVLVAALAGTKLLDRTTSRSRIFLILLFCVVGGGLAARTVVRQQHWQSTLAIYRANKEADPDNCRAVCSYGLELYRTGSLRDAIPVLQDCLDSCQKRHTVYRSLAAALRDIGQFEESRRVARSGLYHFPDSAELTVLWAYAAASLEKKDEALRALRQAEALYHVNPLLDFNVARSYHLIGELNKARAMYHKYLEHVPEQPKAIIRLVELTMEQGKLEDAHAYAQYLVGIAPENKHGEELLSEVEEKLANDSQTQPSNH